MAEHFAGEEALARDLTTLVSWFNETLGEAETIDVRNRLANDAAFDALAEEFSQFTLARNVLRANPRFVVERVLNQIRAMARNGPLGPVDPKYALAVSAIFRVVPEEEAEAENQRFAADEVLFEIFMRLGMMDAFCDDLQSAEDITKRTSAGQQHSTTR